MDRENLVRPARIDFLMHISGIAASFIFLVFVAVIGTLHPDYSHLTQAISVLGAREAPYKDFLNFGCLVPVGILTFIFSISMLWNIRGSKFFIISSSLIMLAGIGRFFAGVFPCDPGCAGFYSVSAKLHAVAGLKSLVSGALWVPDSGHW
jgi:hypothetical membrane protein